MRTFNAVQVAHDAIKRVLNKNMVALDATAGNGHDTVFLAKLCRRVYAFDIQDEAVKQLNKRLKREGIDNVVLMHDDHANIQHHALEPFMVAMFNLGYLPGYDKTIKTRPTSTLCALRAVCETIRVGGVITITCYQGHPGGVEETEAVREFGRELQPNQFAVIEHNAPHHTNAPITFIIQKKQYGGAHDDT